MKLPIFIFVFLKYAHFFLSPFRGHRGLGYEVTTSFLEEKYPSPGAKSTPKALLFLDIGLHFRLVPADGPTNFYGQYGEFAHSQIVPDGLLPDIQELAELLYVHETLFHGFSFLKI
jgi:hypothetical protein